MKFANKAYLLNIVLLVLCTGVLQAQTSINGRVFDASTKDPLIGASVAIAGTTEGTVTDYDGAFALRSDASLPVVLNVSYIGYKPKEVKLESRLKTWKSCCPKRLSPPMS